MAHSLKKPNGSDFLFRTDFFDDEALVFSINKFFENRLQHVFYISVGEQNFKHHTIL